MYYLNYYSDGKITYVPMDVVFASIYFQRRIHIPIECISHRYAPGLVAFAVQVADHESLKTLQMLKAFHCDQIQGFVYSKAVSPSDFRELLSEQPFEIMHEQ
ncbi:MAG: hypothetical protein AAGJ37_14765 [Pseudomonadota bacterium]